MIYNQENTKHENFLLRVLGVSVIVLAIFLTWNLDANAQARCNGKDHRDVDRYCDWSPSFPDIPQNELDAYQDWAPEQIVVQSWNRFSCSSGKCYDLEVMYSKGYFGDDRADEMNELRNNKNWYSNCWNCNAYFTMDHRIKNDGSSQEQPLTVKNDDYWTSGVPSNQTYYDIDGDNNAELAFTGQVPSSNWIAFGSVWHENQERCGSTNGGNNRDTYNWVTELTLSGKFGVNDTYNTLWGSNTSVGMGFPAQYFIEPCTTRALNRNAKIEAQFATNLGVAGVSSEVIGVEGSSSALVKVGRMITTTTGIEEYINWSLDVALPTMINAPAKKLLTVVTFNTPISYDLFDKLLDMDDIQLTSMQVSFKNTVANSENHDWTVSVGDIHENQYIAELNNMVMEAERIVEAENNSDVSLSPDGIIAFKGWLDKDTISYLNANEFVMLADVAPSYGRMLASELDQIEIDGSESMGLDGYPDSLETHVHHLYYTTSLIDSDFNGEPTSVSLNHTSQIAGQNRELLVAVGLLALLIITAIPTYQNQK